MMTTKELTRLIAEGLNCREIAERAGCSPNEVDNKIFAKWGGITTARKMIWGQLLRELDAAS